MIDDVIDKVLIAVVIGVAVYGIIVTIGFIILLICAILEILGI